MVKKKFKCFTVELKLLNPTYTSQDSLTSHYFWNRLNLEWGERSFGGYGLQFKRQACEAATGLGLHPVRVRIQLRRYCNIFFITPTTVSTISQKRTKLTIVELVVNERNWRDDYSLFSFESRPDAG